MAVGILREVYRLACGHHCIDSCASRLNLFYRALRVIEHGFSARREYLLKDGQTLVAGPDRLCCYIVGASVPVL